MPDVLFAPWRYEYLVSDKQSGCIFCEAAASHDDDRSLVVFRGKRVFVLLNRYPYTNGHVMVAPYAHEAWFSDSAAETLSAGRRARGQTRRRLTAATGHALAFTTWRSLTQDNGLNDTEAAGLMGQLVTTVTGTTGTMPRA